MDIRHAYYAAEQAKREADRLYEMARKALIDEMWETWLQAAREQRPLQEGEIEELHRHPDHTLDTARLPIARLIHSCEVVRNGRTIQITTVRQEFSPYRNTVNCTHTTTTKHWMRTGRGAEWAYRFKVFNPYRDEA